MGILRTQSFWLLIVVAVIGSACSSGESVTLEPRATESTVAPVETTTTTTRAEVPQEPEELVPTNFSGPERIRFATIDGRRLAVGFTSGTSDRNNLCSWEFDLDVIEETSETVEVQVMATRALSPGASASACIQRRTPSTKATVLAEPLGDRTLIDAGFATVIEPASFETRLAPTELPVLGGERGDGIELNLNSQDGDLIVRLANYGRANHVMVRSEPTEGASRLVRIGVNGAREPITIRNSDDGLFRSGASGRTVIWFEEDGWAYRIDGSAEMDVSAVVDFARSFERLDFDPTQQAEDEAPIGLFGLVQ